MSAQLLVDTVIGLLAVSSVSLFALILVDKFKSQPRKRAQSEAAHCRSALTA